MSANDPYQAKLDGKRWFAILARGSMAFRFGPIEAADVGKVMEQSHREGIPMSFVGDMGPEIDWELCRDLRGYATTEPGKQPGVCGGCGQPLLKENAWMEDGCPCNTKAGVNHGNQLISDWRNELRQEAQAKLAELQKQIGS
jgi:hypothetical protein